MTLPAPNLDDRRFQDLVDDSKRMIQRKWPEWTGWTDHNVSDPGVTLIETFAYMVDQLLYRLNRVPDLVYVKLLELIGVELQPPTAAVAPVTFWLTAPQSFPVTIPAGIEVATDRTEGLDPVVFRTSVALTIPPVSRVAVASEASGSGVVVDLTDRLLAAAEVPVFSTRPTPGDCFYVGLSAPAPRGAVVVRVGGEVEGYGINPDRPPLVWQAWDGAAWQRCELEADSTGGFNRAGDVVLHVPDGHRTSTVGQRRAAWLRCVVTEPPPGGRPYDAPPRLRKLEVFSVGGTVDAIHAEEVRGEILGSAEGVPGQRLSVERAPVVLSPEAEVLEVAVQVAGPGGTTVAHVEEWRRVESFADAGPDDACFAIDPSNGHVHLPPAVRLPDGSVRRFGRVPPAGAVLRLRSYRTGGGRRGNVAAGTIRCLRSSLPLVRHAQNRDGAAGGMDGETIEEAKVRGPLTLRARDRAVTAADYEHLAREAAPEIARTRCVDVGSSGPGAVRVLVVPHVDEGPAGPGRIRLEQLRPSDETFGRVVERLEERRVIGVRLAVEVPRYQGVTVVARLRATQDAAPRDVERLALDALYTHYHPVLGGPDGRGWPWGRPIQSGEVHAVLQRVPGVELVEEASLFTYDVDSGRRGSEPLSRIDVAANDLVLSFGHQVRAEHRP